MIEPRCEMPIIQGANAGEKCTRRDGHTGKHRGLTSYKRILAHGNLRNAKVRAREKGLAFSLTIETLPPIPDKCPVLGIPIRASEGVQNDNSPSLDRIIPELGYVPGNVRYISNRANRFKNNATSDELRLVLEDSLRIDKEFRNAH